MSLVTAQARVAAGVLELSLGHPGPELLPRALLDSMLPTLAAGDTAVLQYGAEPGDDRFRAALAQFLTAEGSPTSPENLFLTAGASGALDLICTVFTRPGDAVLVESPTYHLALGVFADHGLTLRSLPPNETGLDLEALETAFAAGSVKLFYLVPSFANPTGRTLAAAQHEEVLRLCARYGVLLVADEVYRLLNFSGTPPPTLARPDAEHVTENVIVLGSFSKILAPGLRLGWLAAHPRVLARVETSGLLRSGGGLNPFTAALTRTFVESGALSKHLVSLRTVYAARASALAGALQEALQELGDALPEASFRMPEGGYFLWVRVPGTDSAALLPGARALGTSYQPGALFSEGFSDHYRLSFSHYPPDLLRDAARRFVRAVL